MLRVRCASLSFWMGVVLVCAGALRAGELQQEPFVAGAPAAPAAYWLELHEVPLRDALNRIALRTGTSLFYETTLVPERRVSLPGARYIPEEAFARVLAGTDLEAKPGGRDVFVLRQVARVRNVTLVGRVLDAETGAPLPGVNVFLAYTTRGTATDANGFYRIEDVPPGSYELAASMVGYEPQVVQAEIQPGAGEIRRDFRPHPVLLQMGQIQVVEQHPRTRRKHLRAFEERLLGTSPFAREARLQNPEVLSFAVDSVSRELVATASAPLRIENRGLGYRVTFVLQSFRWDRRTGVVRFGGLPHFEAMKPVSPREARTWARNRAHAYRGSLQHLLQSMMLGRTFEEGFLLHLEDENEGSAYRMRRPFPVEDEVLLVRATDTTGHELRFRGDLRVVYRRMPVFIGSRAPRPSEQVSWMTLTGRAFVSEDGYLYPWHAVRLSGHIGLQRLADLLPRDYRGEGEH